MTQHIDSLDALPDGVTTCVAPMEELEDDDVELCGEPATQYKEFCEMMLPYCDEHAAEIDEMSEDDKGNEPSESRSRKRKKGSPRKNQKRLRKTSKR